MFAVPKVSYHFWAFQFHVFAWLLRPPGQMSSFGATRYFWMTRLIYFAIHYLMILHLSPTFAILQSSRKDHHWGPYTYWLPQWLLPTPRSILCNLAQSVISLFSDLQSIYRHFWFHSQVILSLSLRRRFTAQTPPWACSTPE